MKTNILENESDSLNFGKQISHEKLFLSDFVPQFKILGDRKVNFFVTHGGLGSMIDLVKQKVPAICTPRFSDQFLNSAKMEKLSVGIWVNDFTIEDIEQAIDKIQPNYKKYQKTSNSWQMN